MTLALWCVMIAVFMPYLWTALAKASGRYGRRANHQPRQFLEELSGRGKRAHWAQLNSFEALPGFIAAVLVAQYSHAAQASINILAVAWVALRLLYGIVYMADQATWRSLVWFASLACVLGLFVLAATA